MEGRREVALTVLVGVLAGLLALVSARDQADAWNDASRLATVEALVDYRTWAIDDSIFAGTKDKLFIGGRYYSDKSPVPALYLGGVYQVYRWLGGAAAVDDSARFVWLMTLAYDTQPSNRMYPAAMSVIVYVVGAGFAALVYFGR